MAEPLLISDVDDKHCHDCPAGWTSFHSADRFMLFKNRREVARPYSRRRYARTSSVSQFGLHRSLLMFLRN